MERLLAAAARLGISGPAALAKAMNESDQTVTNWSKRGVSKAGAIKAQELFGVSSAQIISGQGPMPPGPVAVQAGPPTLAQALEVVAAALSSVPVDKRQALLGVLATYASDPVQESNSLSYLQSELAKTQARAGVHPSSIATGQPPGGKV